MSENKIKVENYGSEKEGSEAEAVEGVQCRRAFSVGGAGGEGGNSEGSSAEGSADNPRAENRGGAEIHRREILGFCGEGTKIGLPGNGGLENEVSPILNNMGGPNPQGNQNPSKSAVSGYWCGIDQLTLTYSIDWRENWTGEGVKKVEVDQVLTAAEQADGFKRKTQTFIFERGSHLRDRFDAYHLQAMKAGEPVAMKEFDGALMHPFGGGIGGKTCRFKIELTGCLILIADQQRFRGDWPNVKIEIGGTQCLCYPGGAAAAYLAGVEFLDLLGATIHKERVNRLDVCLDLPGWSMQGFIGLAQGRRWTCRSKKYLPRIYNSGTTLLWGEGGALMLRIYDKLKEQEMKSLKGSPAKFLHMVEKRWGGVIPECAVRVEYQIRRDALKTFGVTGYDSMAEYLPEMLKYLTGVGATFEKWSKKDGGFKKQYDARWFRFLTKQPDAKNPQRNVLNPRWAIIQKAFAQPILEPAHMREIEPEKADITALVKQAFGVLSTAACNRGYAIPGKTSTAPQIYKFGSYESFEAWMCTEMRKVAIENGEWNLKEKPYTEIDEEIDAINFDYWLNEPLPEDVLQMIRLENLIEDERAAELIGA